MIYNTKGIVLRTIKYGETSIVVNIFTEVFGIRSYLVNGIRTSGKSSSKAVFFQPASILEMEVYNNELKNLQRIKEYKWSYLYKNILSDVIKNTVAIYMIELLQKCLKQPETNIALFKFTEGAFQHLDIAGETVTANYPVYFSIRLADYFGLNIRDNYSKQNTVLDLREGIFIADIPYHTDYLQGDNSNNISRMLKVREPADLSGLKLNKTTRKEMLFGLLIFYTFHVPGFSSMKTPAILQEILM